MKTSLSRVVRPSTAQVISLTVEVIGDVGKLQFDHVQILWRTVYQTVARGTPLGFREEISMMAKHFPARAQQLGHSLTLNSFPAHMCSVPDTERLPSVQQEMGREKYSWLINLTQYIQNGNKSEN